MRFVCVVLFFGLSVWAQTFPVGKLEITGNQNISSEEIVAALSFRVGDVIDRDKVLAGAKAIEDLGYFSQVTPQVSLEEGQVVVRYRVVEFPKIEGIVILGVPEEPKGGKTLWSWMQIWMEQLLQPPRVYEKRVGEILSENGVKPGEVLNQKRLQKALEAVLEEYRQKDIGTVQVAEVVPAAKLIIRFEELPVLAHEIRGLSTVPEEEARKLISTPVGEVGRISKIQESLAQLTRSVYFPQARVIPEVMPGGVKLVWELAERVILSAPRELRGLKVLGSTVLPPVQVEKLVEPFPEGTVNNFQVLMALRPLHDHYRREGFLLVDFVPEGVQDGLLVVRVKEGQLGEVEIKGLTRTAEWVVYRVLDLRPGQILTEARLAVSHQNLMSLGYFSEVNLAPAWVEDQVRLTIEVKELEKLGSITGSVSLSPEARGLVGNLTYSQKNIFGTAQDLSLTFSRGLSESQETTWSFGYVGRAFPAFTQVQVDLYRREEEKRITTGGGVKTSCPIADYLDLILGFTTEKALDLPDRHLRPRNVLEIGLIWDDRDNPHFARRGGRVQLSLEKAGTFAPGAEYLAGRGELTHFWPADLREYRAALAVRGLLRLSFDLPEEHWFNLGGVDSVRGAQKVKTDRLALLNGEFRIELAQGAWFAPFLDIGVDLRTTTWKLAPGLEVAVNLGGMFVRISASWPNDREPTWVPAFEFGMSPMF